MKTCPVCSGEVIGKSNKVFCSENCRSLNWIRKNKDWFNERSRRGYHKNVEKSRAYSKLKYARLKVARLAYSKKWKARNRDKCRIYNQKSKAIRRALVASADIGDLRIIAVWWKSVKSHRETKCFWCKKSVSVKVIHCDHIVPISRGGGHNVENLCVACPECNHAKHVKPLSEWNMQIKEPVLL